MKGLSTYNEPSSGSLTVGVTKKADTAKMGFCLLNGHKIMKLKVTVLPSGDPKIPDAVFLSHPSLPKTVQVAPGAKIKGKFLYLCMNCNRYAWFEK